MRFVILLISILSSLIAAQLYTAVLLLRILHWWLGLVLKTLSSKPCLASPQALSSFLVSRLSKLPCFSGFVYKYAYHATLVLVSLPRNRVVSLKTLF